jgi:hypothetical protein
MSRIIVFLRLILTALTYSTYRGISITPEIGSNITNVITNSYEVQDN